MTDLTGPVDTAMLQTTTAAEPPSSEEKIRGTFAVFVRDGHVYLVIHTDATGELRQEIPRFAINQLLKQQPAIRQLLGI